MSIIRIHKRRDNERRWSVLDNAPVENPLLSWEAKAVLWYGLTKPDDWTVRIEDVVNNGTLGRDGVIAVLKELEAFGYAYRWEKRGAGGTFEYGTELYEDPSINPHFDPATAPTQPLRARSKKKKKKDRAGSTDAAASNSPVNSGEQTTTESVQPDRLEEVGEAVPAQARRSIADRASTIARLAVAQTNDSLTLKSAEWAAMDRLEANPGASDLAIAADIARHYAPAQAPPDGSDRDGEAVTVKPTLPNTEEPKTKEEESSNEDSIKSPSTLLAEELAAKLGKTIEEGPTGVRRFLEQQREIAKAAAELSGRGRKPTKRPTEQEWKSVVSVFAAWKEIRGKNANAKLTPERARAVLDRLRSPVGFTVEDIANGIRGVQYSAHHSGQNEKGEVYDDLELICRTDQKLESFIGYFERGAAAQKGNGSGDGRFNEGRGSNTSGGSGGGRGETERERNLRESGEVFDWRTLDR